MQVSKVPKGISRKIEWVTPKLIAKVEFLEMTRDGVLRHASFKGLCEDKKTFTLSHPDKVLYPKEGLTKLDIASYYESIAELILPYIINRPLMVLRCPSGKLEDCFYQKHVNKTVASGIHSVDIVERGKPNIHISIHNLEGLVGLVQMGVLEIHAWGANNKHLEKPDWIVFDLDPAPQVKWGEVIECAFLLRQFLDSLSLKSFVKTTGGKGLHVVVPIRPHLMWNEIQAFTKQIADILVALHPDKYIATMSKAKRSGKIFIDYLRNTRGATAIAPYSTRAKVSASVAVPLAWEELSTKIKPDSFDVKNLNKRLKPLKEDPWKDFFKTRQTITVKMRKEVSRLIHLLLNGTNAQTSSLHGCLLLPTSSRTINN